MDTSSQFTDEEDASRLLSRMLDFIALVMERPDEAASRAALALTVSALVITVVTFLLGGALVGVTFAALYAAAGWGLSLYLRRKFGEGCDDA